MTLKDLCEILKERGSFNDSCTFISEYLRINKNKYQYEPLDKADVEGLPIYELCYILSLYEYLAIKSGTRIEQWLDDYVGVSCPKEQNHLYMELKSNPLAPENADILFDTALEEAIEPFKSRGLTNQVVYYTV